MTNLIVRCGALGLMALASLNYQGAAESQVASGSSALQDSANASEDGPRPTPDRMPAYMRDQMFSGQKFVGVAGLAWDRKTLSVAFEGGSEPLYRLIEATAAEWAPAGSPITLSFRDASGKYRRWSAQDKLVSAAIRISFRSGKQFGGYWSMIGRLAQPLPANVPTMNLEGYPDKLAPFLNGGQADRWQRSYFRSVILHEFGHAFGLAHEHFHPDCQNDLDVEGAIAALIRNEGWDDDQARFNIKASYYFDKLEAQIGKDLPGTNPARTLSDRIDGESVMLYGFERSLMRSGSNSPCRITAPQGYATRLSVLDRVAFDKFYPQNRLN